MGAGKTTLARSVAVRFGWAHADSDVELERVAGLSGAQLALRDGVDALHDLEDQVLLSALESTARCVISAAASVVESARCRDALARCAFVAWIDLPTDVLLQRMASGSHRREMAPAEVERIATLRNPGFGSMADIRLNGCRSVDALTTQLAAVAEIAMGAPPPPLRPVQIETIPDS